MEGNNKQVAVATFKFGLLRESQLRQSLMKRSPATQEELMDRIEEFLELKEDLTVPRAKVDSLGRGRVQKEKKKRGWRRPEDGSYRTHKVGL